ncbi:MAG: ATP-binding cassette domain-containing protein [Bacillota bacterium]
MLELQNISFFIEEDGRKKEIIKDVSFRVDEKFVVITGPNGGGKSTIAKLIMGIEKPSSGKIFFKGKDITGLSVTERANIGMSFAFQQPVKFKGIKVFDLISLAVGKGSPISVEEACAYLLEVGLCAKEYLDREVDDSLSGGELKRIEIAMMMARGTELSILDEPEAGIDLWSFQNLIKVFERMHDVGKGSILIISHQERILNVADKIIVIENGKVSKDGTKEKILPGLLSELDSCEHFAI